MLTTLIEYFTTYGYWVVFFGVMLENAGIPVPGETVLLAAGFFAAQGHFNLFLVMIVAASGAIIGDNAGYFVGRKVGRATIERYGRRVWLSPERLAKMDGFFARHGNKTILFARFVTGIRVFAALFAGAARMKWSSFALYNIAGAILWSVAITLLGFFFGHSWNLLQRWLGRTGLIALVLLCVAGGGVYLFRKIRHRRSTLNTDTVTSPDARRGESKRGRDKTVRGKE